MLSFAAGWQGTPLAGRGSKDVLLLWGEITQLQRLKVALFIEHPSQFACTKLRWELDRVWSLVSVHSDLHNNEHLP